MEKCIEVDRVGFGEGLALLWKEGVNVKLLSKSTEHIDYFVEVPCMENFYFRGLYGHLEMLKREQSWELIRRLLKPPKVAWLICGNFNKIVSLDEKLGGEIMSQL